MSGEEKFVVASAVGCVVFAVVAAAVVVDVAAESMSAEASTHHTR